MTEADEQTSLIKRAQKGDKAAFETLLRAHYDLMYRIAFKWSGSKADAEDIAQSACIKLARSIGTFRFRSAFSTWLTRLVINSAKDWAKARSQPPAHQELETGASEAPVAENAIFARQVLAFLRRMPQREQIALLLVFGEELTHREAATVMQCKESTVSWYIHEARKKLRAFQNQECRHG